MDFYSGRRTPCGECAAPRVGQAAAPARPALGKSAGSGSSSSKLGGGLVKSFSRGKEVELAGAGSEQLMVEDSPRSDDAGAVAHV